MPNLDATDPKNPAGGTTPPDGGENPKPGGGPGNGDGNPSGGDDNMISMSKADFNELLNKVRSDEKKLRYAAVDQYTEKLQEAERDKATLAARIAAFEALPPATTESDDRPSDDVPPAERKPDKQKKTQTKDTDTHTENQSKPFDVEAFKEELHAQFQRDMKVQVDAIRDEAALQIHMANLGTYKTKAVTQSGLDELFMDMVQGDTKEEIDAAVQIALQKQRQIEERLDARKREELGDLVPNGGFSPSGGYGSQFGDKIGNFTPLDRQRLARIHDNAEFRSIKESLLTQASQLVRGNQRRQ